MIYYIILYYVILYYIILINEQYVLIDLLILFLKRDHVIATHDFHFENHATIRVWLPFRFYSRSIFYL